jgi:hypothetical protein
MPFSYEIKYWYDGNLEENYGSVFGEHYIDAMKYLLECYEKQEVESVTLSIVANDLIVTDDKEAFKRFQEVLQI